MPKGFTEKERDIIRTRLIESGMQAFGRWGIKKTSVNELAKMAGISKGGFYLFFKSKEDLYFNIIREFETGIHRQILEQMAEEGDDERKLLKSIFITLMKQIEEVPFIRALFEKKEYQYIHQKFTQEQVEEAINADLDLSVQLIGILEKKGKLKMDNPELVTGFFRSVFFLLLHKEDIGENIFPDVIDFVLDTGIDGLIKA